jgi:shikimate dehydrogenase
MLIMDANYRPKTDFIAKANLAGAKAIDGLEMLVRQAALSFRLWTGTEPPIGVMRDAAIEARAQQ